MTSTCVSCKKTIEEWNETCGSCGFKLVLEPEDAARGRYLRGLSLGALLWTQGWTFGARLYLWFLLSLIPVAGIVALIMCVLFGRRWSWKYGGWKDWSEFQSRMRLMDGVGVVWMVGLLIIYFWARYGGG